MLNVSGLERILVKVWLHKEEAEVDQHRGVHRPLDTWGMQVHELGELARNGEPLRWAMMRGMFFRRPAT